MGIAHLVLAQPAAAELVDQMAPGQAVVDDGSRPAQCVDPRRHCSRRLAIRTSATVRSGTGHTVVPMTHLVSATTLPTTANCDCAATSPASACSSWASRRRRTPSRWPAAGAKAIALDPSADKIAPLRLRRRSRRGAGRVPPGRAGRPRLRDQWLDRPRRRRAFAGPRRRPAAAAAPGAPRAEAGASFVVAMTHPVAAMFDGGDPTAKRRYGADGVTVQRAVHGVRAHQLPPRRDARVEHPPRPRRRRRRPRWCLRARKQGD